MGKNIRIYTDASKRGSIYAFAAINPSESGFSVVVKDKEKIIHNTNTAEMIAAYLGVIRYSDTDKKITVLTDSYTLFNTIRQCRRKKNHWKYLINGMRHEEADWRIGYMLDHLITMDNLEVKYIKGHSGLTWNESAHNLAWSAGKFASNGYPDKHLPDYQKKSKDMMKGQPWTGMSAYPSLRDAIVDFIPEHLNTRY